MTWLPRTYGSECKNGTPTPFHGDYYRILDKQGRNAPGGAKRYVVDGKMTNGFGFLAYQDRIKSATPTLHITHHIERERHLSCTHPASGGINLNRSAGKEVVQKMLPGTCYRTLILHLVEHEWQAVHLEDEGAAMISKCRWGAPEFPEFPTIPNSCPRLTNSPRFGITLPFLRCA